MTPTNLIGRILRNTAQCQDKNIHQQWAAGVRYFDLRVKEKNGCFVFAHGIVEYDITPIISVMYFLMDKSMQDRVYIRLMLESTFGSSQAEIDKFMALAHDLMGMSANYDIQWRVSVKNPAKDLIDNFSVRWCEAFRGIEGIWMALRGPRHYLKDQKERVAARERDGFEGIVAVDFV